MTLHRLLIRYLLFLVAYLPLYVIAAIRLINGPFYTEEEVFVGLDVIISNNLTSVLLLVLSFVLLLFFMVYSKFKFKPSSRNRLFKIKNVEHNEDKYIAYLGTYILPFLGLEMQSIFDVVAVVLLFLIIGYIYCRTPLIYTNPTLTFFGYDVIKVTDDKETVYDAITKEDLKAGDEPCGKKLASNTFYLEKRTP